MGNTSQIVPTGYALYDMLVWGEDWEDLAALLEVSLASAGGGVYRVVRVETSFQTSLENVIDMVRALRFSLSIVTVVSFVLGWTNADACKTVKSCVGLAKKTPKNFTPKFKRLSKKLTISAKVNGLGFADSNKTLEKHVRAIIRLELNEMPPKTLSPSNVKILSKHLMAADLPYERGQFMVILRESKTGKKWLLDYLRGNENKLAIAIATQFLGEPLSTKDRAKTMKLIWDQYLKERVAPVSAPTDPHVGHFIQNNCELFVNKIRALLVANATKGQALNSNDLGIYSCRESKDFYQDMLGWSKHKSANVAKSAMRELLRNLAYNFEPDQLEDAAFLARLRQFLIAHATIPDAELRLMVLTALRVFYQKMPSQSLFDLVAKFSSDSKAEIRKYSVWVIGNIVRQEKNRRVALKAILEKTFRDSSLDVVFASVRASHSLEKNAQKAVIATALKQMPEGRFYDPSWQRTILNMGTILQQRTGKYFGFGEKNRKRPVLVGGCDHGNLMKRMRKERDSEIFGLKPKPSKHAQPPMLDKKEIQKRVREAGKKLLKARAKFIEAG